MAAAPDAAELDHACALAAAAGGINEGHVAVAFVDESAIAKLNAEHRGRDTPTDVLSFPVDGAEAAAGPRELGDVVICPALAADLVEAVIHGTLHLIGMDHEIDGGEMLVVQDEILSWVRRR